MNSKLKECLVVTSNFFINGKRTSDSSRTKKEYLIIDMKEEMPCMTSGNRMTSYTNSLLAIELNEDGSYNENNQKIEFSTCHVYRGSIAEEDITVVREMKKTYI